MKKAMVRALTGLLAVVGLLAGATLAPAQKAKVIQLEPKDAAAARAAWENLQAAEKRWGEVQRAISLHYLVVKPGDPEVGNQDYSPGSILGDGGSVTLNPCQIVGSEACTDEQKIKLAEEQDRAHQQYLARRQVQRRGFESCCVNVLPAFDFSEDFKFIVPRLPAKPACSQSWWGPGTITTLP